MRSCCGLYGGAAYMLTPESSFDDFGVVRLVQPGGLYSENYGSPNC